MAALRPMWVAIFLVGLFAFSVFTFTFGLINKNNPTSSVLTSPAFNDTYVGLNNSLSSFQSSVSNLQNITQNDKKQSTVSVFLILDSILTVPWSLVTLAYGIVNIMANFVFVYLFGGNTYILFGVLLGILTGTFLFLIIKFVRSGESER